MTMAKSADEQALRRTTYRLVQVGGDARRRLLAKLTYREREVMLMRTGLGYDGMYTLEEVGRIFKVTRASVRSVEKRALAKLAAMLDEEEKNHGVPTD